MSITSESYGESDLKDALLNLGVKRGDCLFIHSALRALGRFTPARKLNGLEAILEVLKECVGETGTLAVPTFNFAFCKGEIIDIQKVPGDGMGALSEYIRQHNDSLRTYHPFHSISVIGKNADYIFKSKGYSEFSEGSFFDALLKTRCKILFYGVDFVETFVHLAEERAKVPYRFWKTFHGEVIDNGGLKSIDVNFYARNLDLVPEPQLDIFKISSYLKGRGLIQSTPLGAGIISICDANLLVDDLTEKLKEDPNFALMAQ